MLEGGDAAERVTREIVGLLMLAGHQRVKAIGDGFFLERDLDAAQEWAAGNAVDRDIGHDASPFR